MSARNLGVVFGRESPTSSLVSSFTANVSIIATLMRSRDPAVEFSDMAGKAISVEWLVDNAPAVFATAFS
jgi:Rho-type GTPase-activating protein 1/2